MLSDYQRAKCRVLREEGKSFRAIADAVGTTRQTASKWASRAGPSSLRDKLRIGRPRITSAREDMNIVEKATRGSRRASLTEIAEHSGTTKGGHPSVTTTWRRLQEAGIGQFNPTKKPFLTAAHRQKRLEFAEANKTRAWRNTLFHDERKYILGPPKKKVWRKRGEIYIESTVKHPCSVNAWACFGHGGYGRIFVFRKNLNAVRLKKILKRYMLPAIPTMLGARHPTRVFSYHDNDPKYTSKRVRAYLSKHNIVNAGQPPQSPDLNPIENLFSIHATNVRKHQPKTVDEFEAVILREWKKLPKKYISTLVGSMKKRMADVITAQGGHTKW